MARTVGSAADETRTRILDVAVDLFIEKGYAGTSVRDISERLGMTKGSLYYHFASKEDVLNALVTPMMEDLESVVTDRGAGDTRALVEELVTLLDGHGVLLRSLMGDPSVLHGLAVKRSVPERMARLQRALGGADDEASLLRGRCALGLIHSGVVAPRWDASPDTRAAMIRRRLSDQDKRFVVNAAMAVLSLRP
jgi:AcrR family transcriptional regulator